MAGYVGRSAAAVTVSGLQTCDDVLVQTAIPYPTVIPAEQSAWSNRAIEASGRYDAVPTSGGGERATFPAARALLGT